MTYLHLVKIPGNWGSEGPKGEGCGGEQESNAQTLRQTLASTDQRVPGQNKVDTFLAFDLLLYFYDNSIQNHIILTARVHT